MNAAAPNAKRVRTAWCVSPGSGAPTPGPGYSTSSWRILNDGNPDTFVETSSDLNPVLGVAYYPPVLCNKIRLVNRRGCPPCAQRLVGCELKVYAPNGEEVFKHRFSSTSDGAEYVFTL